MIRFGSKSSFVLIVGSLLLGCRGQDGTIGPRGFNSLINTLKEPAGPNCEFGGLKVDSGVDTDVNGMLDSHEVLHTDYVCSTAGKNSLIKTSGETAGLNCEFGGLKVQSGVDSNSNGALETDEILATDYICRMAGENSLINVVDEQPGANCVNGGIRVEIGIDDNRDGTLEVEEIDIIRYICTLAGSFFESGLLDIQGNGYPVVQIGTQWWMAQNLRVTKYNDGTIIPNITDNSAWENTTSAAYCYYGNDDTNKIPNGALYNWHVINPATNGGKNVCPQGWHVPTAIDWFTLQSFVDPTVSTFAAGIQGTDFGTKMKSKTGWSSGNGTDEFKFNGLPTGYRWLDGSFSDPTGITYHWSVTPCDNCTSGLGGGFTSALASSVSEAWNNALQTNNGFCIRCVKD